MLLVFRYLRTSLFTGFGMIGFRLRDGQSVLSISTSSSTNGRIWLVDRPGVFRIAIKSACSGVGTVVRRARLRFPYISCRIDKLYDDMTLSITLLRDCRA